MIEINGHSYRVIDAHVHVWDHFDGMRFGNTKVKALGYGMVRQGDTEFLFMPPEYVDNTAPVEILLSHMETNGVEKAVLLQNPCYGDQRDYIKEVIANYPGRFVSLGMIDPRDKGEVIQQMDILMNEYHFKGFKIEVPDVPFIMDDPEYNFLWKKIIDMNAVAALDLGWGFGPFDFNIERFSNVVVKYPELKVVLCHLGVSRLNDPNEIAPYPHLRKTLALLDISKDNLYMDFSGLQPVDPTLDFPFPKSLDILKTVKELVGMDRILWGSDGPTLFRTCSYRESLRCLAYCDFLTQGDLKRLLYDNAQKVYFSEG